MDKSTKYKKVISDLSRYFQGYTISKVGKMSIIASTLSNEFPEWIFCGFYRVISKELLEIGVLIFVKKNKKNSWVLKQMPLVNGSIGGI